VTKFYSSFFIVVYTALCLLMTSSIHAQSADIVIKNGHVIDAKNGIDAVMDIAVTNGVISMVMPNIAISGASKVIDAEGLLVTPGLIDIHGHYFHGTVPNDYLSNSFNALSPDGFTLRSGVTTTVDVGGAGWRSFETFKEQTIDRSKTRVLSFINIVGAGMKGITEEQNMDDMDSDLTAALAMEFPDYIVGVKLAHFLGHDWTPVERAVAAGELADIPVMIDFGVSDPELSLAELFLNKLRPGDIFTHTYAHVSGRMPIVDDDGNVRLVVHDAQKRGIVFDVGHGGGSFLFEQALPAMAQGIVPDTISTDLHRGSMNGGMKDITNVMSKFLSMDMTVPEVVERVTWRPAQVIDREELGHLSVGAVADITLLNLQKGEFGFVDVAGARIDGDLKFVCELTIRDGQVVYDLNGLSNINYRATESGK